MLGDGIASEKRGVLPRTVVVHQNLKSSFRSLTLFPARGSGEEMVEYHSFSFLEPLPYGENVLVYLVFPNLTN